MKRRLFLTVMLAVIGMVAASAQDKEPKEPVGPLLNVSCSGPEASYEIITHEIVKDQIRRYSHPIMRVKEYNGTDVVSKWKFNIEEADLEQLRLQLHKSKMWKQNGYEPKNPPRGASLCGFKLLYEMDQEVSMCFADPKENKKVTEAYNIVNDFCRNLAEQHPPKQRADLIYASCAAPITADWAKTSTKCITTQAPSRRFYRHFGITRLNILKRSILLRMKW